MGERPPIAEAYVDGWRAGHRALRGAEVNLSEAISGEEIEALAATEARLFMEDRMERHNLTWREGVHHFFSFFEGYKDGARLRVTMQTARFEMLRRNQRVANARQAPRPRSGA